MHTRKVIFLDFDGVMDTMKYVLYLTKHNLPEKDEFGVLFDPECIAALKHIIDKTNAEVVISSSWKDYMDLEQLKIMWEKRHLPGIPVDTTPSISTHREEEINAWLNQCSEPCQYVIIDDWPHERFSKIHITHLISTDGFDGLTMSLANKSIHILNNS